MIALRLNEHHKSPAEMEALLEQIRLHKQGCDEIWLASDYGFPPLAVHQESARMMRRAAEMLRREGLRVSLQISNTLGHGPYIKRRDCSGLIYDGATVGHMAGLDGTVSDYCFCWNDPQFREYSYAVVREYAQIEPECVWIDDDLRAHNHEPLSMGCFCDNCLAKFRALENIEITRDELREEFELGNTETRGKYIQFIRDGLADYTALLTQAVMDVSPNSQMGYQYYLGSAHSGTDVDFIFDAMQSASGKPPQSRPGGGYYSDYNPNDMLDKMMVISYANAKKPSYVAEVCPEVENTPDVFFGKSIYGTCLESTMYLSYGCNALSYATLMNAYEPMEWHGKMLGEFARHRPFWQALADQNAGAHNSGVCVFLPEYSHLQKRESDQDANDWTKVFWNEGKSFLRLGLPICHNRAGAVAYLLSSKVIGAMTHQEIMTLLDQPVVTDGAALKKLVQRGYGECFSAVAAAVDTIYDQERFDRHAINHNAEGVIWRRGGLNSELKAYVLSDRTGMTEPFATYVSCQNAEEHGTANAIVKTYGKKCGSWAVFGYGLWDTIMSFDKRNQILSAVDYICDKRLPAWVQSRSQLCVVPHTNPEGNLVSVTLLNCGIEDTTPVKLLIRNPANRQFTYWADGGEKRGLSLQQDGEEQYLLLPSIRGWHSAAVFADTPLFFGH